MIMCSASLQVYGDVAFDWPIREPRFWSNKEIMGKKTILNGCHIVPRGPRGQRYNEWRIPFLAVKLELLHALTPY